MAADSKSKKIFDLYVEAGLIDEKATPFKKWEKANERQQKALFELGVERKLFVPEDFEAFSSLWNVKKKMASLLLKKKYRHQLHRFKRILVPWVLHLSRQIV